MSLLTQSISPTPVSSGRFYEEETKPSFWPPTFVLKQFDPPEEQSLRILICCYLPHDLRSRMMIAIAFVAATTLLRCASADSISTSLLLPNGLFSTYSSLPTMSFVGQVTVTRSTTYYTLDCGAGAAATYFTPGDEGCSGSSYTFSEISASTQYLLENFGYLAGTGAASTYTDLAIETDLVDRRSGTINCSPLDTSGSATCTTTFTDEEDFTSLDSIIDPTYITNIESSLYAVIFTAASGYSAASSTTATSATPSPTSSAPTAKSTSTSSPKSSTSTTAHPPLGPSSRVGIGLGVPLGACALAGVALLLYRHGKHKERSRMSQMGNLAPPGGFVSEPEGKRMSEAAVASQALGRQPPVYSMEMQG
ncbi:MAG: hypothetical protein ASARMPREDX12_009451 [Alectoria sarmentosa]|nr:MAG: hypothetical protein ASARMPREDX12_000792 [Alectoria sarmentosa]CAD6580090.1 MAG: hypothetical protein ASARMPREDX12_009451 [Alectoria sarmentosa]